jgi:hypothetical protein
MNTEKPITDSAEILNRIDRFAYDADWSTEELRESLRAEDIDPDSALTTIKNSLASIYKFKEPEPESNSVEDRKVSETIFPGIIVVAEKLGFDADVLGDMTGWGEIFILKLDRRLVSVAGRSKALASILAEKLNYAVEPIRQYISGNSLLPAEGNFKSDALPEISEKQEFEEAVEKDPIMGEEIKTFLLSLHDED